MEPEAKKDEKKVEFAPTVEDHPFDPVIKSQSNRINRNLLKDPKNKKLLKKKKTVSLKMSKIDQEEEEKNKHSAKEEKEIKIKSQAVYNKNDDKIDDIYLKNLNKVNKIKANDDFIVTVLKALELTEGSKAKFMKQRSSAMAIGGNRLHLQAVDAIATKTKVFDEGLDDTSKLTLENTILNKFQKEVSGTVEKIKVKK